MNWDEAFGGMDKMEQKSMFLNALLVAAADGNIDHNEANVLRLIQQRLGLSQREIEEIRAETKNFKFKLPKTEKERFAHLVDLVYVMIADGVIDPAEAKLVEGFAVLLGFKPVAVPAIVQHIAQAIKNNKNLRNWMYVTI